jgi:hypothetical protein
MDSCDTGGTCVSQPETGFAAVTCLFEGTGLATPDCAHSHVPIGLSRRYTRARNLIQRAATTPAPARARRRLRQAAKGLTAAIRITNATEARGLMSQACADSLTGLFKNARTGAEQLASTL